MLDIADEENWYIESVAKERLKEKNIIIYSDEEVWVELTNVPIVIDENDGWE